MILCLWVTGTQAQEALFTGKQGEELYQLLVNEYTPGALMNYGPTRDTMYQKVYRDVDGQVECYYTGYKTLLPLNVDPSSYLYDNGADLGITAEHIYPQSKGASEEPARSDMHCLVPAIWRVNEARSNYPFGEVPDDETDHWYYKDEDLIQIPQLEKDAYSERLNGGWGNPGLFEPRESIKGDIARAVFYFHTIYRAEAELADPDFFVDMKEVLYDWHLQDPVDAREAELNELKARYQNGKLNPYILDCSLVRRSYFDHITMDECTDADGTSIHETLQEHFFLSPNPVYDQLVIHSDASADSYLLEIFNPAGRLMIRKELRGTQSLDLSEIPSGLYTVVLTTAVGRQQASRFVKL